MLTSGDSRRLLHWIESRAARALFLHLCTLKALWVLPIHLLDEGSQSSRASRALHSSLSQEASPKYCSHLDGVHPLRAGQGWPARL
jgi:hypothetical protein